MPDVPRSSRRVATTVKKCEVKEPRASIDMQNLHLTCFNSYTSSHSIPAMGRTGCLGHFVI